MTPVLVDSNVILDVAADDARWSDWSTAALLRAMDEAVVVINAIIYAEVSVGFERVENLEAALPMDLYRRDALPCEAAFLAGKCFRAYRSRGGARVARRCRASTSAPTRRLRATACSPAMRRVTGPTSRRSS